MIELVITLFLISAGFFIGSYFERSHYKSIEKREEQWRHIPIVTGKRFLATDQVVKKAELVIANVVIGQDYFKRVLASLKSIFGGRLTSYETLIDRGRREAILRMVEKEPGANLFTNVRLETSTIGINTQKKTLGSIEILAYGTAIFYE